MPIRASEPADAAPVATSRPTWTLAPWLLFVGSAVAYWLGSRLAFELADRSGLGAVFFVPAGITLALLVRTPTSRWWLVLAAAAVVEFGSDLQTGLSAPSAAGFAAANVVEPLIGAMLMLRWADARVGLARRRSVAAFLVGAVAIGPIVGAVFGATTDYAANADAWWETLWQWWLGDALAVLIVGGSLLAWTSPLTRLPRAGRWRFAALLLLVAVMPAMTTGLSDVPLEFLTTALVIVAGGLLGARGAAAAAAVAAVSMAIVLGFEDSPVWMGVSDATAWATIKAQLGVATIAGLALAAEVYERQAHAETVVIAESERQNAAFTRRVLDQLISFVTVLTPEGTVIETNHVPLRADGLPDPDVIGRPVWEAPWWRYDPAVQQQLAVAVAQAATGALASYDVPMRIDDVDLWVELQISPLRNDHGTITHLIKTCTDLTERRESQLSLAATAAAERATRERVELLGRVAGNLAATVTMEDVADAVLADIEAALGPQLVALDVRECDEVHTYAGRAGDRSDLGSGPTGEIAVGLPGPAAIVSNQLIVLDSFDAIVEHFPAAAEVAKRHHVESIAAFPIRSSVAEANATLVVGATDADWFTSDRIELLDSIAAQTAQAIGRARLHAEVVASRDREHAIALRLQDALLPDELVEHVDLDTAARYLAATEALTVGGDWYDTFTWADGHIGLMVGDVVGHDLEAAATMGRLRAALAALVPLGPPDPASVLDALDACATGPDGAEFVTAACVVIDLAASRLAYATAGHPPPLVVTSDGHVERLDQAVSTPAGRLTSSHRKQAVLAFPPGATVVLYTDGLIERRGLPITDGIDRLADAAQAISDRRVPTAIEWVDGLLDLMTDGFVGDDVAVLVARRPLVSPVFRHQFPADKRHLRDLRRHLGEWLAASGIDESARTDVLLAVGEAATNAIEHAYRNVGTGETGTVDVDLTRTGDEIIVHVVDHGTWKPAVSEPGRGRGTPIMQSIADHFERRTGADGTIVTMRLPATRR